MARECNLSTETSEDVKAIAFQCDISDEGKVHQVFDQIYGHFGRVDILINNAGVVQCLPFSELKSSNIERTFKVNVFGHFWTIREVLDKMKSANDGHIVAISSIAGLLGTPNLVDYCSSKHATIGLMTALDRELNQNDKNRIKLTTVCPLSINTGMFEKPRTRFEAIFPVLTAEYVASQVIEAIQTDSKLTTVPQTAHWFHKLGG